MILQEAARKLRELLRFGVFQCPEARQEGIAFPRAVGDSVPRMVCGDQVRFRQVLDNLAANAVKFTEGGHVSVHIGIESETGEATTVRCTVEDTGMGISSGTCR